MTEKIFVPPVYCTVLSGDCFYEGECLNSCKPEISKDVAISILKDSVRLLEIQNQHIKTLRLLVNDGRCFEIDSTTKEVTELIALFKELHK